MPWSGFSPLICFRKPVTWNVSFRFVYRVRHANESSNSTTMDPDRNVLGGELQPCSVDPLTGFYRTGSCSTGSEDFGCHAVCAQLTEEFLTFSKAAGNDLSTPAPQYGFPGLKPGDRWCVCAPRWKEALDAGAAPPVILEATHEAALKYVSRSILEEYALSKSEGGEELP